MGSKWGYFFFIHFVHDLLGNAVRFALENKQSSS